MVQWVSKTPNGGFKVKEKGDIKKGDCEEKGHVIAEVTFDSKGRQREQKKIKEKKRKEKKMCTSVRKGGTVELP